MKKSIPLSLWFILITLCSSVFLNAGEEKSKKGSFRWAFVLEDEEHTVSSIEEHVTGKKEITASLLNTKLHIYFCPVKNAYLYLLLDGPGDNLTILFPAGFDIFSTFEYETSRNTLQLLETVKQPGKYKLHIIAAASRQTELEKLLEKYKKLEKKNTRGSANERKGFKKELLFLIQKLKRTSDLKTNKELVFTGEAGTVRIENDIFTPFITKIEFEDLYFELYTFEKK